MLADLHRQRVEAKALELPAQVLQVATDHAAELEPIQRFFDLVQLQDHVRGSRVAARLGRPGPEQPFGHEGKAAPEWLVRKALLQPTGNIGQVGGVQRKAASERLRRLCPDRHRLAQAPAHCLERADDVIELDGHRFESHVRGDVGVAVSVPADPRAE